MMNRKFRFFGVYLQIFQLGLLFLFARVVSFICISYTGSISQSQIHPLRQGTLEPLTIAASTLGEFSNGESWYLSVNASRKAYIQIWKQDGENEKEYVVQKKQFDEVRSLIEEQGFFDLKENEYGQEFLDGGIQSICVTIGNRSKFIRIHNLSEAIDDTTKSLERRSLDFQ